MVIKRAGLYHANQRATERPPPAHTLRAFAEAALREVLNLVLGIAFRTEAISVQ
jgi:hypothetical protein